MIWKTAAALLFASMFPLVDSLAEGKIVYDEETKIIIWILVGVVVLMILISLISVRRKDL